MKKRRRHQAQCQIMEVYKNIGGLGLKGGHHGVDGPVDLDPSRRQDPRQEPEESHQDHCHGDESRQGDLSQGGENLLREGSLPSRRGRRGPSFLLTGEGHGVLVVGY